MRRRYIALLVLLYGCYLVIGAFVFHVLEHTHEKSTCEAVLEELEEYNMTSNFLNPQGSLKRLVQLILMAPASGVQFDSNLTASCAHHWSWHNSFFFAGTVITTIGYGNVAPTTWGGRFFCIFFAIIGLPLFGIMFKEIGSLFAGFFKHFEGKLRGIISEQRLRHCCILGALLTTLIVFFLVIPSFIFAIAEEWEYQEAFYYSFITLTTIGFGDYVTGINPDITYNSFYRVAVYFWVLFGLAFMAAVVNVVSDVIQGKGAKRNLKDESCSGRGGKLTEQTSITMTSFIES